MENKIIFVGLKKIESKKKGTFYIVNYLIDRDVANAFVDEETYLKLEKKKLEFLKEYTALFEITMISGRLNATLHDIK